MSRSQAHYEADTRRTIKGRSEDWLRGYIARHAVRMLVADDYMAEQYGAHLVSPAARSLLRLLQSFSTESTGREQMPRLAEALDDE